MMTDDEIISVVSAHKAGKQIQERQSNYSHWTDCKEHNPPLWDFPRFIYRVKPEMKRRPFTQQEAMKCRWLRVKHSPSGRVCIPIAVDWDAVIIPRPDIPAFTVKFTELADNWECSLDGQTWQPCYVEEAE